MNEAIREQRRGELVTLLADSVTGIDHTLGLNEPLISSGRVNSLALFKLALWIEEQSPRPIDIGGAAGDPSRVFHRRAVPSLAPVTTCSPSGVKHAV